MGLEDLEIRPGSNSSLLRTIVGLHLRAVGGWIAVADLVALCAQVGGSQTGIRSALSRAKGHGLLVAATRGDQQAAGYALGPGAERMLERGDRRIFGYRQMAPGDGWMLVLFSVPEQERSDRHRLRSRLRWLGCGAIGAGTWIGPAHLIDETLDVLSEDGLREYVTVVRTEDPLPPVPLRDAVRAWWNVAELDSRYARFLATHRAGPGSAGTDAEAFAAHVRLVDDWRSLPYLDPGLPAHLAPPEWRASAGVALFAERHAQLAGPAARHVGRHAGVLR